MKENRYLDVILLEILHKSLAELLFTFSRIKFKQSYMLHLRVYISPNYFLKLRFIYCRFSLTSNFLFEYNFLLVLITYKINYDIK